METLVDKIDRQYKRDRQKLDDTYSAVIQARAEELFSKLQRLCPDVKQVLIGNGGYYMVCEHARTRNVAGSYAPSCATEAMWLAASNDSTPEYEYGQLIAENGWRVSKRVGTLMKSLQELLDYGNDNMGFERDLK
jgi:hypothetical protein